MGVDRNVNWNYTDSRKKMAALGWPTKDWTDLDAIVASRHARKPEIMHRLQLTAQDHVLDLGSGMGFIAEVIAPEVERLCCADVSEVYLRDCKTRLAHLSNVDLCRMTYADLSPLYKFRFTKAYSTLLFIHFNFYDIVLYLAELAKVMAPGGLVYFDYNDGERFSLGNNQDSFNEHLKIYKENREHWIFGCMHMTSQSVLRHIAPQIGFDVMENWTSDTSYSQMLLRKKS